MLTLVLILVSTVCRTILYILNSKWILHAAYSENMYINANIVNTFIIVYFTLSLYFPRLSNRGCSVDLYTEASVQTLNCTWVQLIGTYVQQNFGREFLFQWQLPTYVVVNWIMHFLHLCLHFLQGDLRAAYTGLI